MGWCAGCAASSGLKYWSLAGYLKHQVKNAVSCIGKFQHAVALEASLLIDFIDFLWSLPETMESCEVTHPNPFEPQSRSRGGIFRCPVSRDRSL